MSPKSATGEGELARNRKAGFEYEILEKFECGIQLTGTEVKSLRGGGGSFADSYVHVDRGEAWLEGFHIRGYEHAGPAFQHPPVRTRKLLLARREIERLRAEAGTRGHTIVPLRVFTRGRWIKLEVAVARGKKLHDKRRAEKERIMDREAARAVRDRRR